MTTHAQQVLEKAVALPPIERAELVEGILSGFDFPPWADIDAAWAREAEDRIDAYEQGEIAAIPASKVFEKIEKKYSSYRDVSEMKSQPLSTIPNPHS
jgi:putative addiction module component (TIGR02574 family)